jgi:hypothetical protein
MKQRLSRCVVARLGEKGESVVKAVAFACACVLWAFPGHAQEIRKDFGAFVITAHRPGAPAPDDLLRYHIRWTDGSEVDFGLYDQPLAAQPLIQTYGSSRLLIRTEKQCFVINLRTGDVVDQFFGFDSSVSPDGRHIGHERSMPNGALVDDSVYLVYDLERTPAENRMVPFGLQVDAGFAVYPSENVNARQSRLNPDERHAHHRLSPLRWISPSRLLFVDSLASSIELVAVDVSNGIDKPQVATTPVDLRPFINETKLPPYDQRAFRVRVRAIEPLTSDASATLVRLTLESEVWLRSTDIDVSISN